MDALADLVAAFALHDRVQLHSAPGTGKTLVGRWHAEASGAQRVLVLVPSLALLAQTLREWRRIRSWPFEALVVCSDPTTSTGAAERETDSEDTEMGPTWADVRAKVTTNPQEADLFLRHAKPGRPQVIFSTYHSAPAVAAAQKSSGAVFDLTVCDEAHRLAGTPREEFRVALDPRGVVARRRLFMTATPRMAGPDGYSMDDPRLFGPVAHTVTFGEAIKAGLLCDYQVLVVGDRNGSVHDDPMSLTPAALFDAVDHHGVTRVLSFHGRVAKAAAFARAVDGVRTPAGRLIAGRHVSGAMPTERRTAGLVWLADPQPPEVRLVANARVLTEGIDVPAIDAVFFADQRSSVVDILQAVGRVLRPSPGKRIGTIIVPIPLADGVDDDTELMLSRFSLLWSVLRSLRSHDQRFASEMDRATHGQVRHGKWSYRPARVQFLLPLEVEEQLQLRLVQEVGDAWEKFYAVTQLWAFRNPGRRLPRATHLEGLPIGEWAVRQRLAHARGILPADRARRLEDLPEWYWDRLDAAWEDTYSILQAYAAAYGTVAEHPEAPSRFVGLRAAQPTRERLGMWLAVQRQAHRAGLLDPARAELLEALPDWTWHPIPVEELGYVDALRQFAEFEKHAVIPDGHMEDGLPLGRWAWSIRRRKLLGTLHPALEDEIWAATPSRWRSGTRTRWQWEKPETQWRLAYSALRQYAAREGHANPATTVREQVDGSRVHVGQWVSLQRHLHRKEELEARRVAVLERLPGWSWAGDVGGTRPFEEPLQLPPSLAHGSAGAIARGCHCEVCVMTRRARERKWLAGQRTRAAAGGVPAGRAYRHLHRLEHQLQDLLASDESRRHVNIGRSLVAATSGVPLGVLRQLGAGTKSTVLKEHETRLLATTVEACMSNTASGSRGRTVQRSARRHDAAETWRQVRDLESRGFNLGWMGRELGYSGCLQLSPDHVTQRVAEQIAALHAAVGDLVAPALPRNQKIPSLAELRLSREVA